GLVVLPRPGDGVLRDSPLGGTARRLPALQVPHQREGRPPPREQGRHARCVETREGADLLHALVRRTREDGRRRHPLELRRRFLPDDLRGAESEMAPRRGDWTRRRRDGRLRGYRGARPPGPIVARDPSRRSRWRSPETQVLSIREDDVRWDTGPHLSDGLYRRFGIRDL